MIIDSHCHIDFADFDNDRQQVIERAMASGVSQMIVPGVQQNSWSRIRDYCQQFDILHPCYGLHPYFIEQHTPADLDLLRNWLEENTAVAVGECGLDFFLKELDRQQQQFYFEQQLQIALEFNLPVVVHARKSTEAVIDAIKKRPGLRGMIHSYSGSYEQAIKLINLNFYLSFGGPVSFEKATRLRKLVQSLPIESLLVETDAPDQAGQNAAGQRNEPAFIREVVATIATLHQLDFDEVAQITRENANQLFQLV